MTAAGLDMTLHPPARLQLAAILSRVSEAEFSTLREITGVADSVLSKHLSALVDTGYLTLRKGARDGRQRTWASLTGKGRRAFAGHVAALRALADPADPSLAP